MIDLIIETDLGHDPDDMFAICYLIATGKVNIRTILISPGDPDQVAIARFICKFFNLDIPIGVSKLNRNKLTSGSIHYDLLNRYGMSLTANHDGLGVDILTDVLKTYPDSELFVIGPVSSIGSYIKKHPEFVFKKATMQGGFLPYNLFRPNVIQSDYESCVSMPTFNLNGDRKSGEIFLSANILERRMVGKNICHTVCYTENEYINTGNYDNNAGGQLFHLAANYYFAKHNSKKMHDPTAAVLHLHPEVGVWYRGKTVKCDHGWSTIPDDNGDYILADINYNKLWNYLLNWI